MFFKYCLTSDLTWAGYVSIGGNLKSSKLFANYIFKFVLKNKFSLKINSVSFSNKTAPLKNSSLDAINGLNLIPVYVLNLLEVCLSYINAFIF